MGCDARQALSRHCVAELGNNQITNSAFMGAVGLDWQISGFANNQVTGANVLGTVGLEWQFAGVAPIHGPGTSDLVLRNVNTGQFEVYNIATNQITGAAALGQVGLEWQLGGFAADASAASMGSSDDSTSQLVQASDLVLRNVNSGAFQVYNIANNQLTGSASLGAAGLDWHLGGFAAISPTASMGSSDASTSQLVQAMAGFGGG